MERRVQAFQARGHSLRLRIEALPSSKALPACTARLLKLVRGELNFLDRLAVNGVQCLDSLASSNFDHLEAVVELLEDPRVHGVCAAMQRFSSNKSAQVDLVGFYDSRPAWFLVSDRNPRHILWKELQGKVDCLLQAALANRVVKPACIILFFAKGVTGDVGRKVEQEFKARRVEEPSALPEVGADEWVLVDDQGVEAEEGSANDWVSVQNRVMYQMDLDRETPVNVCVKLSSVVDFWVPQAPSSAFDKILAEVNDRWGCTSRAAKLVNLDTTALIGMVSGISNGGAAHLATCSPVQLEKKFNSFGVFFRDQAKLELEKPFLPEVASIFQERQPIVSRFAWDEFQSIASVVGGPEERARAAALHDCLRPFIVPDLPSERVLALPSTGKIQRKHIIVFGTGDSMLAPTLTSNLSFVRAATAKGMVVGFIKHRPLALTRD